MKKYFKVSVDSCAYKEIQGILSESPECDGRYGVVIEDYESQKCKIGVLFDRKWRQKCKIGVPFDRNGRR